MAVKDKFPTADEIKRYLFVEMAEDEAARFEEAMFADDELFFEVADTENRLVDAYTLGELASDDAARFERSLDAMPGRRAKIANARSLNEFIDEERAVEHVAVAVAGESVWQRLMGFLGGTPAFGAAMAGLLVVMTIAVGVLVFQNRQNSSELARLEEQQRRQAELQSEIDGLRQRESELRSTIDLERDASGDIQEELERERRKREAVEAELGKLKNAPPTQPSGPIIASLVLFPSGGRGGPSSDLKIGPETKRVSLKLPLPGNVTTEDRLTVKLNQKVTARDVAPRGSGGKFSLNINVPVQSLTKGKNTVQVTTTDGKPVENYDFNVINNP